MDYNAIQFDQLQQQLSKQQLKEISQIYRILKIIISQNNGQILQQFPTSIEFNMKIPKQNYEHLNLFYLMDFKQSYFTIQCCFPLPQFDKIIKSKGYYHFLTLFNDWNMSNNCGQKIIWVQDQKIVKIKTSNLLLQKNNKMLNNLACRFKLIGEEMIDFIVSLNPRFQKTQDNKKLQRNVWGNYKSEEQVEGLRQLQITFKDFLKFHYQTSMIYNNNQMQTEDQQNIQKAFADRAFGKLNEKIKKYLDEKYKTVQRKKQWQSKKIVEYVRIISQEQISIQLQLSSSCCKIQSFLFQYEIFPSNSYYKQTNDLLQEQIKQFFQKYKQQIQKKNQLSEDKMRYQNHEGRFIQDKQKGVMVREILLQKAPLKQDPRPFQNQKLVLLCIRAFDCEQIAQYYLESITDTSEVKRILIRPYLKSINFKFNLNTKLILLFRTALGLYFLHNYRITHRDLKPSNIPLDNGLMPKIIDFGSACFTKLVRSQKQHYNVPQLRTTRHYNKFYNQVSFDLSEVMTKKEYETHELFDVHAFGRITEMLLDDDLSRRYLGDTGHQFVTFLISKCTQPNPNLRLTPYMIILFLAQMQITKLSTILATRPIKSRKII